VPDKTRKKLRALLPSWVPPDHPLFLNALAQRRIRRNFDERGIFLNIPYGPGYSKLEMAILSTVTAYDMNPRMARDRSRMEVRLQKIVELMLSCPYGLTDLSYVKRMNMPLELGLLLAYGKETFVTTSRGYASLKSISDLNFCDLHHHGGSVGNLILGLSRWIEQNCSGKRLRTRTLLQRYRRLQQIRDGLGVDFDRLTPQQIVRLLGVAQDELGMLLSDT